MSALSILGEFLTGGGLTSAATGVVGAVTKYKELKLQYQHEKDKWAYEVQMYAAQTDHERYLAEQKRLTVTETVNAETLQAAIRGDSAEIVAAINAGKGLSGWMMARTLFRPFITSALFVAIVTVPFIDMPTITDQAMMSPLADKAVSTITQGFAAALGFWFGSRAIGESPRR